MSCLRDNEAVLVSGQHVFPALHPALNYFVLAVRTVLHEVMYVTPAIILLMVLPALTYVQMSQESAASALVYCSFELL